MCTSVEEGDWTSLAMNDATLAAEQLLRLSHSHRSPPAPPPPPPPPPLLPLEARWRVKQPRSKQVLLRKVVVTAAAADSTAASSRASPTTPLSWRSHRSSPSPGLETGFEASSFQFIDALKPVVVADSVRSKAAATANGTTSAKRSRKKKTLPELKEEESSLLKERRLLRKQLAVLRHTLEKQRAENESLKRIKRERLSHETHEVTSLSIKFGEVSPLQPHQINGSQFYSTCSVVPTGAVCIRNEESSPKTNDSFQLREMQIIEASFSLPDLNIMPGEDGSCSDVLYGLS